MTDVATRMRMLRIAHLTDIHIRSEERVLSEVERALSHVSSVDPLPNVIFGGGDMVQDVSPVTKESAAEQWRVFHSSFTDVVKIPVEHTIGNHDIWSIADPSKTNADREYGKKWACDELGLQTRYRSFDRSGWHFIALDSTMPLEGGGYQSRLDEEQFEWLQGDLESVAPETPIMVMSHAPIVAACAMFDGPNERSGNWVIPGAWVHIDARRIKDLFACYPNIKVCISGHIHLVDRVDYNGVTYLCNGAVCGNWWKGTYQECPPGYALIDLFDDGSFERRYVTLDGSEGA